MRLLTLGFEAGIAGSAGEELDGYNGANCTRDTGTFRSGVAAGKCAGTSGAAATWRQGFAGIAERTYYQRMYVRFTALPSADTGILEFRTAGGTALLIAKLKTTGKLALYRGDGTTQIGSDSAATMAVNTWYQVELALKTSATAGSRMAGLRLNGVDVFALAANDHTQSSAPGACWAGWTTAPGVTTDMYLDDFALNDEVRSLELEIEADAPVGYWRLDDLGGTIANEYAAANGITPLDGTYTGGFTLGQPGPLKHRKAVELNGTTGYVTVPNNAAIDIVDATFTAEVWYRALTPTPGTFDQVFNKANVAGTEGWFISVNGTGTGLRFFVAGPTVANAECPVRWDGEWHHVVGVYDGVRLKIYHDGVKFDDWASTGNIVSASTRALQFGRVEAQDYGNFAVAMGVLYGTSLSAERVKAHFDARNQGQSAEQVFWPGEGKIVLLRPTADAQVGTWTGGSGGTSSLFDAVDNTPPIGTATESNTTQIESVDVSGDNTTDEYRATLTTFTAAGIASTDTLKVLQAIVNHGEDAATGTTVGKARISSNPVSNAYDTFTFGNDVGALGTWPANWRTTYGIAEYSPSVALGTAPQVSIRKVDTAANVGSVDFLGIYAEYRTAPAAPALRGVQNGQVTLPADTLTVDVTLGTTLLDITKAFVLCGVNGIVNTNVGRWQVRAQIINTTTVRFSRQDATAGTTPAMTIEWYVAEWTSGVRVQRGTTTVDQWTNNTAKLDLPITQVDLARAFTIVLHTENGTGNGTDDYVRSHLASETLLRLANVQNDGASAVSVNGQADWQVVEYDGARILAGIVDIPSGTTSKAVTLPRSIDTTKSWLLISHTGISSVGNEQQQWKGEITDATTLTFTRNTAGGGTICSIAYFLVEFIDTTIVQKGTQSFISGDATKNVTIAAVDQAKTIVAAAGDRYRTGSSADTETATAAPQSTQFLMDLTTTTNLALTRVGTTTVAAAVSWFVIQFEPTTAFSVAITSQQEVQISAAVVAEVFSGAVASLQAEQFSAITEAPFVEHVYTDSELWTALRTSRLEHFRHELLRYIAPGIQLCRFEPTETWTLGSGAASSSAFDLGVRREGTSSFRISVLPAGTARFDSNTPDVDLSAAALDEVRIWVYVADESVSALNFYLDSTNGNYTNFYNLQILKAAGRWTVGSWSEIRITKAAFGTTGAPTWALITRLGIRVDVSAGTVQGQVFFDDWRMVNSLAASWVKVKDMVEVERDTMTIEYNQYGRIKRRGSVQIHDDGETIDFPNDRIRTYYRVRMQDNGFKELPMGTFYMSAPDLPLETGTIRAVDLYDTTVALEQATLADWISLPAGTNVVATAVAAIQAQVRGAVVIIPASTRTLTQARTWAPDTSYLTYVNNLLAIAGYSSVRADEMGSFVSEDYVRPSLRASSYILQDDGSSLFVRNTGIVKKDMFDAPNQWLVVVSRPDATIRAVYTLTDPANPLSTYVRGRTITKVLSLDLPDQAAADKAAKDAAEEGQLHYAEFEIQTPIIPVGHADRVRLIHSRAPDDSGEYIEHTWKMECKSGGVITHQYDHLGTAVV